MTFELHQNIKPRRLETPILKWFGSNKNKIQTKQVYS